MGTEKRYGEGVHLAVEHEEHLRSSGLKDDPIKEQDSITSEMNHDLNRNGSGGDKGLAPDQKCTDI